MFKRLILLLGVAIMLSSMPIIASSQTTTNEKTGEHHTGVKRTYNKAKRTTKKTWNKAKATTKKTYNKAKTRVTTDDEKKDAQERK